MTVLYQNLSVPFDVPETELRTRLAEKLRIPRGRILEVAVERKSLDSRGGRPPRFVYVLKLELEPEIERAQSMTVRREGA